MAAENKPVTFSRTTEAYILLCEFLKAKHMGYNIDVIQNPDGQFVEISSWFLGTDYKKLGVICTKDLTKGVIEAQYYCYSKMLEVLTEMDKSGQLVINFSSKRILLDKLIALQSNTDGEMAHEQAEFLLLEYIGDYEISEAFSKIKRFYA